MKNSDQYFEGILNIIETATKRYKEGSLVEKKDEIPVTDNMPLENNIWWRIDDVICVYIDMKDSTKLSAQSRDKYTAGIYQYFTDTAVRILNHFGASYIDVRGDGAFGLFDQNMLYHAFASAVTFKTFVEFEVNEQIGNSESTNISSHIGMDMKTILVKRIGIRRIEGKTDKQNEVWAGKPVNMAAKLASRGGKHELLISERIYKVFLEDGSDFVLKTCGCVHGTGETGEKVDTWKEIELNSEIFDFKKASVLRNHWCIRHGREFCEGTLQLD